MGRPRRSETADPTPARILAAAEEVFARRGFEAARLEDIAAAAGVRRPSLLYHFPSKEKLYAAVVQSAFAQLRDSLVRSMTGEGPFMVRVESALRSYIHFLATRPDPTRIFVREILDAGPGEALLRQQVVPMLDLAETFLREAGGPAVRDGVDIRAVLLQVVGGAILYAIAERLRGPLWDGTRPLPPTREGAQRRDARFTAATIALAGTLVIEPKTLAAAVRDAGRRPERQAGSPRARSARSRPGAKPIDAAGDREPSGRARGAPRNRRPR